MIKDWNQATIMSRTLPIMPMMVSGHLPLQLIGTVYVIIATFIIHKVCVDSSFYVARCLNWKKKDTLWRTLSTAPMLETSLQSSTISFRALPLLESLYVYCSPVYTYFLFNYFCIALMYT